MPITRWRYIVPLRLRSLLRRSRVDAELDEEILDHIERQTVQNIAAGLSPLDARAAALRQFGDVVRHKEQVRDARGVTAIEHLAQDLRFAARVLRKNPVFATIAILTLALGIGANTAIFGVVQSVLLRPVPFAHPDRLVTVFETDTHGSLVGVSKLDFQDWRRASRSFVHLAGVGLFGANVKTGAASSWASSAQVSPELFEILGVPPLLGTVFTNTNQSVVISEGFWKRELGGADVIGKPLVVDDTARLITGIMPARFDFPHRVDLWIPQDMLPRVKVGRTIRYWQIVADLKPGVSVAAAQRELSTVAQRLAEIYPTTNAGVGVKVVNLEDSLTGNVRPTLLLLTVIAALVLLLACANLANLMLVRGMARRRELAVRTALGATRSRLQRQLLTECLLLAVGGAALGIPFALWCGVALRELPQVQSVPFELHGSNWLVLLFAAIVTLSTTIVFGLAPAVRATRVDLLTSLKDAGGRGITALGLSGGLVAVEVALATVLLVGASLTGRSLARLEGESLGFDPDHVLVLRSGGGIRGKAGLARARQLLDDVRRIPSIASAATVDLPPFSERTTTSLLVEGEPSGDRAAWHQAIPRTVSDGFFQTLRIPIKKGRDFMPADAVAAPVAIINEALAHADLSWLDPIGARIALPELDTVMWAAHQRGAEVWATIVGVVADIREQELGVPPQPTAYLFRDQHPDWWSLYGNIVARAPIQPARAGAALTRIAINMNPSVTPSVTELSESISRSVKAPRVRAIVLAAFAALALVLASIGVYGVTAHVTAQRTAEIGIRMALGATSQQVLIAVSSRVVSYAAGGLVIGLALALAAARLIPALLYGIGPTDFVAFALAGILAALIAMFAAWIPARRATRIDPTEALRAE